MTKPGSGSNLPDRGVGDVLTPPSGSRKLGPADHLVQPQGDIEIKTPNTVPVDSRRVTVNPVNEPVDTEDAAHTAMRSKIKRFVLTVVIIAALGGALFGYDTGVISGVLVYLTPDFGLSPTQVGVITSSLLVGAAIGSLTGGWMADRFGRRMTLLFAAALFFVGALAQAVSPNPTFMIVTRLLLGVAVGTASLVVPMYVSEIAPATYRGRLVSMNSLMIASGQLLAYIINALLAPTANWRLMLAMAAIPAIALFAGMLFMPDSPRWYLKQGREDDARKVLRRSYFPENVEPTITAIEQADQADRAVKASLRDQLRKPKVRALFWTGVGLALIQQFVGVNTVVYYAPSTLTQAGLGDSSAVTSSIGIGVGAVLGVMTGMSLVDRIGRRPTMFIGMAVMIVALVAMAAAERLLPNEPASGYILLAMMIVYIGSFQVGVGVPTWLLLSEIFPAPIRSVAMSITTFLVWAGNFVVSLVFPPLGDLWGPSTMFLIFAVIGVVSVIFCYRRVPETKGVSLEQITAVAES
ncbi:sugar porter family MFS transporter [Nocardia caishijiensis]|uniref:Major inositol transporter-like SP family MFS transporter n=1 Tax=Nocardia caishijiensis TaxID=184756 RepID=A0ABQ6YP22_9NOCA|nr:sugar porter family MFS transporter [Nocardia caishijiensis]KAF0847552.1 major inositol transporter-like SP family MFS transporter [Nocardia caishijiensis]